MRFHCHTLLRYGLRSGSLRLSGRRSLLNPVDDLLGGTGSRHARSTGTSPVTGCNGLRHRSRVWGRRRANHTGTLGRGCWSSADLQCGPSVHSGGGAHRLGSRGKVGLFGFGQRLETALLRFLCPCGRSLLDSSFGLLLSASLLLLVGPSPSFIPLELLLGPTGVAALDLVALIAVGEFWTDVEPCSSCLETEERWRESWGFWELEK